MIRLILLGILFFLVYTLVQGVLRTLRHRTPPTRRHRDGEEMVMDPQCEKYLPIGDALPATINGQRIYFCSKRCRNLYRKNAGTGKNR